MTLPDRNSSQVASPHSPVLPESWPIADAPEPVRTAWIPWPIAVLLAPLFWLMPRRFGPHFAAAGWWAAIVAHLTWTIYGIGSLLIVYTTDGSYSLLSWLAGRTPEQLGHTLSPVPGLGEIIRAPLGMLAVQAFGLSNTSPMGFSRTDDLVWMLVYWCLMELGLVILAALLMPYIAVGERTRYLFARTIRLLLWSTTSLVVLAFALQVVSLAGTLSDSDTLLIVGLYIAWTLWQAIRSGTRYAGPTMGPAWEQRTPHCEACGYSLTGLPIAGTCPECGTAVADSLPGKRQPSAFAAASGPFSRLRAFLPTVMAACRDRGFYRSLKTSDQNAARRFVVWMCAVTAAMVIVPWMIGIRLTRDSSIPVMAWTDWTAALLAFWVYASTVLILLAGMTVLILSGFGRRRLEHYAAGIFYWSAWMFPIAAPLPVTIAVAFWLHEPDRPLGTIAGLGLVAFLVSIWMLVKALFALKYAIRGVRFANR